MKEASTIKALVELPVSAIAITAPAPDLLSQKNVTAFTGIPPRVYLGLIRSQGFPLPVTRLGKLRLVNRAAFVSYLESRASVPGLSASPVDDDDELVDRILADVGLRRKPPAPITELRATRTTRIRGTLR